MANKCERRTLIKNDICQVTYCADCGTVHLSLGAMTLHMTAEQFEQLAKSLGAAAKGKRDIDAGRSGPEFRPAEVMH
jgi:hypothetical protein